MASIISRTIIAKKFDEAFTEVKRPLGDNKFYNGNSVRFFHLNLRDCCFILEDMERFLGKNLARYFYSRAERFDMEEEIEDATRRAYRTILEMMKTKDVIPSRELGAMLIYAFLESLEDAPKIMSCVEIEKGSWSTRRSETDGIHLAPDGTILFSSSSLNGDMNKAVDEAMGKMSRIKSQIDKEIRIIKDNALELMKDADLETVKSILLPREGVSAAYSTGFSVFIGYDIGLEKRGRTNEQFREAVEAKMIRDIQECSNRVHMRLEKYDFSPADKISFYFLPFNQIDDDVEKVFLHVIEGTV